jgi:acyl-CoA synthetase (AMP-forming)/AMP-acid ligase II
MKLDYLNLFRGTAIIKNDKSYSFEELHNRIFYYKKKLELYSYSVIAIISDFDFESICLLIAISTTNNTAVPIVNTIEEEVSNKLQISNTNIVFTYNNDKTELVGNYINKLENSFKSSGIILFSSGTTGTPKMMFHKFSNLFNILENPSKRQREIVILIFLMFDHIGGINTLLQCMKDGSTIVIPSNRTPEEIVTLIQKYKVNILPTTPTFLNLMLISLSGAYDKLKSLKLISYGTERMPQQILLKLKQDLPNVKLLQTFGTSETGILKTVSKSSDSLYFKIDDDRYSYKIVEDILYIKSLYNVSGYLNASSDKFDSDGWYNTGDIVNIDQDGFMMIVGRINELINVGGLKVMPIEVEKVLMELDIIQDCLVYGKFNVIAGQMVCAKIQLKNNIDNKSDIEIKKNIKAYCKTKLDKYKIPVKIDIVKNLEFSSRFKKIIK